MSLALQTPVDTSMLQLDPAEATERIGQAIRDQVFGLRRKGVVLGLSGGIDSSVTAALCAPSLGGGTCPGALDARAR